MNIDSLPLAELQVYAQVVQHRGFAAAARHLQITTSAVSRSVSRLEAQLGVKLLNRTTRALSMTEIGTEVHAASLLMLQGAEQALASASAHREQPQGVLRVSAPMVFGDIWFAPRLPRFRRLYPDVQVQLQMSDAMADLHADGIDLAIRIATPESLQPLLVARGLTSIRYLMVAHPDYLATHARIDSPEDLRAHRCMSLGYGAFQNMVELRRNDGKSAVAHQVRLQTPLTIASSFGMLQTLLGDADAGIGLVADFVALSALADGRIEQILPQWELAGSYAPRMAYAVHAPGPLMPPKLRAMLDFLQTECSAA